MPRSDLSKRLPLLAGTAALLLGGCPDPQEKYDEWIDRTADRREGNGGAGPGTGVADITGTFLLAMNTVVGPGQFLLFRATSELNLTEEGTCPPEGCLLNLQVQPIVPFDRRSINPNCPPSGTDVGDLIVLENVPVSEEGDFVADFGEQRVPGCGNPISGGNIVATLQLVGSTFSENVYCGSVTGRVSQPVQSSLVGSTFAAERANGAITEPDPYLVACPTDDGTGGTGGGGAGGAGGAGGEGGEGGEGGAGGEGGVGL